MNPEKFISSSVNRIIDEAATIIEDKTIYQMFSQALSNTLDTTISYSLDKNNRPSTYVITGDINAMWLRDSSAQVWPYLKFVAEEHKLQQMIAGVINRQSYYISLDPYANAFNYDGNNGELSPWQNDITEMRPELHERKWEIDSLCYHIRLSYHYWQRTQDMSVFDDNWLESAKLIYQTFKAQQLKNGKYSYTFERCTTAATDTLADHGRGNPVKPIGLIASSFRPSDDATILPFLIPANFFAVLSLHQLAEIINRCYTTKNNHNNNNRLAKSDGAVSTLINDIKELADEIEQALWRHAVVTHKQFGDIFAYEIDGFGSQIIMDDANIPSLLSLPYLGCIDINNLVYQNTRKMILSKDNPWYFEGHAISGVGSIHTGRDKVWPLALIMQALTSNSKEEQSYCINLLANSHANTYFMHESIDKDDQNNFTRDWFAWANSLFAELIIKHYNLLSIHTLHLEL